MFTHLGISPDGRITSESFMAEYNQDRFELEIIAKETEAPQRMARTKVLVVNHLNCILIDCFKSSLFSYCYTCLGMDI